MISFGNRYPRYGLAGTHPESHLLAVTVPFFILFFLRSRRPLLRLIGIEGAEGIVLICLIVGIGTRKLADLNVKLFQKWIFFGNGHQSSGCSIDELFGADLSDDAVIVFGRSRIGG